MSIDIMSGVIYAPCPAPNPDHGSFCYDQQKWNLLVLMDEHAETTVNPRLGTNGIAQSIDKFMDGATRDALRKPPLEFFEYWRGIGERGAMLTLLVPLGYVERRAHEIHRRLSILATEDNVVHVRFGTR